MCFFSLCVVITFFLECDVSICKILLCHVQIFLTFNICNEKERIIFIVRNGNQNLSVCDLTSILYYNKMCIICIDYMFKVTK